MTDTEWEAELDERQRYVENIPLEHARLISHLIGRPFPPSPRKRSRLRRQIDRLTGWALEGGA